MRLCHVPPRLRPGQVCKVRHGQVIPRVQDATGIRCTSLQEGDVGETARGVVRCLVALSVATTALTIVPAAYAGTPTVPVPSFVLPTLPSTWSALGAGTLLSPDAAGGTTAIVGTDVKAQVGTVDFTGTSGPGTYSYKWLSCPSRGAADGNCTAEDAVSSQTGNPSGIIRTYVPNADDVGRYLRFVLTVTPSGAGDTSRVVTSDPSKDVYVIGQSPAGAQPDVGSSQSPGTNGTAVLKKWTIPASSNFRIREVAAWACTSSSAGQTASKDFVPSSAGCTSLTVLTNVAAVSDQTAIVFTIPADATGKYLLVSDVVTTATGPSSILASYVVRSAAVALKGSSPVSPTPSPTSTATPTPSPTLNPTPATSTLIVTSAKKAPQGASYTVSVTVSPTATGTASVRLVTRKKKPKTAQTLASVSVVNGSGTSQTKISKGVAKGKYTLIVQFIDTKTGKTLTTNRNVRVT